MLTSLDIRNVVLIEHLTIIFRAGLCALTGETGAGKSILLDSLGLAIGARAENRLVRKGQDKATVTAVFDLSSYKKDDPVLTEIFEALEDSGVVIEQGESLILRRVLNSDGGSKAFINDQSVSAGLLRRIGESLVEIHGQFDTRGLLDPSSHRAMLDAYAGVTADLRTAWQTWQEAKARVRDLEEKARTARADEEYLRQALQDIDALDPKAGEEETLAAMRDTLRFRGQILSAIDQASALLNADEDPLSKATGILDRVNDKAPEDVTAALGALDRAMHDVEEARRLLQAAYTDMTGEHTDIESVDDRLHALRMQARKHNCSVDDLPVKRQGLAERLDMIEHGEDILAKAMKAAEAGRSAYIEIAEDVHAVRCDAAEKLDKAVMKELPPLKLDKARFVTRVEKQDEPRWNAEGMDEVRFLVATNPGSEPDALNKVASGGEMARFMLAIKVVMAAGEGAGTMIFDEVDAGVGGAVADAVGERLARLAAEGKQVMVVTHAPQVAARAAAHYIVRKDGADVVTTNVVQLEEAVQRREEIARMLSGATITEEARAAADKLLETGT